jgi:hypothetical protein
VPIPPKTVSASGTAVSNSASDRSSPTLTPDARSSANGRRRSISPATVETVRLHAATSITNTSATGNSDPAPATAASYSSASMGCGAGPSAA